MLKRAIGVFAVEQGSVTLDIRYPDGQLSWKMLPNFNGSASASAVSIKLMVQSKTKTPTLL